MGTLQYAGVGSTSGQEIATKRAVNEIIANTTPNQKSLQADVTTALAGSSALATKALKDDVDKWDGKYAPVSEYATKDEARNIPLSAKNKANGPIELVNGKIPLGLFPPNGAGYVMGPYGWQNVFSPTTSGSAAQVASLVTDKIPAGKKFWPLCFGQLMVVSADTGGRPLVEIKSSGGMLLATGRGRTMFTGPQGISVMPAADSSGWLTSDGSGFSVTMFVSDLNGRPLDTKTQNAAAIGGAVYILLAA